MENGWKTVVRRRLSRRKGKEQLAPKEDRTGTTFFVRNFPERCTAEELWARFSEVGKVEEVFIPGKRDMKGNRFGFVRFSGKCEVETTLDRLNQVWIGTYIIRAYVPKYRRWLAKDEGGKDMRGEEKGQGECRKAIVQADKSGRRMLGVSYSEVLNGTVGDSEKGRKEVGRKERGVESWEENSIQFQSTDTEGKWLEGAFTGYLKGEFSWDDHGEEIQKECEGNIKLTNMGSNMVLIQSTNRKEMGEILNDYDEWLKFW